MPLIKRQFNLNLGQWPGPANQGIVAFTAWDRLPRNIRVRLHRIAWFANAPAGGGAVAAAGSVVTFEFVQASDASSRIILLDAEADSANTTPARFNNTAAVDLSCNTVVPRLLVGGNLAHYELRVSSSGLDPGTGSISTLLVDWDLQPFPDTTGRDGLVV